MTVLHAAHPVDLPYRTRMGSVLRVATVPCRTPVTLSEADPGEVAPVLRLGALGLEYVWHAGALWNVAMAGDCRPATPAGLAAWLADPSGDRMHRNLTHLLARTPLVRAGPYGPEGRQPLSRGGDAFPPAGHRPEGRAAETAAAAVQACLDRDVRVCGGRVLVRSQGPQAYFEGDPGGHALHVSPEYHPGMAPPWNVIVAPGLLPDLWRARMGRIGADGEMPVVSGWLADLPEPASLALRPALLASRTAQWLHYLLDLCLSDRRGVIPRFEAVGDETGEAIASREALAGWAAEGAYGMVPDTEAEEALRCCAGALRVLGRLRLSLPPGWPYTRVNIHDAIARTLDLVEGVALPRLADDRVPNPDDAEAMAGLAP